MITQSILIAASNLVVGAAALAALMRRDRGIRTEDRLPVALSERLDRRSRREAITGALSGAALASDSIIAPL
jgi:hypothetical protein